MARRLVVGHRVGGLEIQILDELWAADGWMSGREVWERLVAELAAVLDRVQRP